MLRIGGGGSAGGGVPAVAIAAWIACSAADRARSIASATAAFCLGEEGADIANQRVFTAALATKRRAMK